MVTKAQTNFFQDKIDLDLFFKKSIYVFWSWFPSFIISPNAFLTNNFYLGHEYILSKGSAIQKGR